MMQPDLVNGRSTTELYKDLTLHLVDSTLSQTELKNVHLSSLKSCETAHSVLCSETCSKGMREAKKKAVAGESGVSLEGALTNSHDV